MLIRALKWSLLMLVRLALTIVQLIVLFITWISEIVFHLLAGFLAIMVIVGYGLGAINGSEAMQMFVVGLVLFALSILAAWVAVRIEISKTCFLKKCYVDGRFLRGK